WTREAAASLESGELPKASGRRRRPQVAGRRAKPSSIIRFAVPLAAAAALIIAVLAVTHEPSRPSANEDDVAVGKNEKPRTLVTPRLPDRPSQPPKKPDEKTPPPDEKTPPPDETTPP